MINDYNSKILFVGLFQFDYAVYTCPSSMTLVGSTNPNVVQNTFQLQCGSCEFIFLKKVSQIYQLKFTTFNSCKLPSFTKLGKMSIYQLCNSPYNIRNDDNCNSTCSNRNTTELHVQHTWIGSFKQIIVTLLVMLIDFPKFLSFYLTSMVSL